MLLSFFQRLGRPFRTMRPGRLIVLVFLFIILLGAGLLCLPAASRSGEPTPFLTSLFTATSATCVTGLIRVDTGTHWTMFGQVVILLLIQVGGLGFMTIACLFFFALLPDMNGFSLCQLIRKKYTYPIIMLTAKIEETDKITGLTFAGVR